MSPHAVHALPSPFDLAAFVTLGLLGSAAHCAGMCAPFVLLVARRFAAPAGRHQPVAAQLWYSAGRVTTYAALGAAAALFGSALQRAAALIGLQRGAALVAGGLLVVSAAGSLLAAAPWASSSRGLSRLTTRLGARMPGHPLAVGLVLGLLPCGLLYTAVVAAMARGGALDGAVALAAFGAGTTPALLGVAMLDRVVLARRVALTRLSHGFVLAMGLWYLGRAAGLLGS
ncbi:MAG: sulfite exporter TauE/SafE family protein [Vicinamibacterales bacterium]